VAVIPRAQIAALAGAGLVAVAAPALLLTRVPAASVDVRASDAPPLAPPPQPALAAIFERPIFAPVADVAEAAPTDAPQLVGIAGRIDRDAVAMVRAGDGATRTLAVGESVDGWRLASLAIDAAFFTRGRERVRVPLPAGEDEAADALDQ
jgi:hypothetical protein